MTEPAAADPLIEALRKYDTPTICNGLELLNPGFMASGFTFEPLICAFPALPPIVGYARTATMRAGFPSGRDTDTDADFMDDYLDHVSKGRPPKIAVVQDLDDRARGRGAIWGEVNTTIHKALGCVGTITNGAVRDLRMIAPNYQLLAGSIAPSHAFGHIVDFGCDVMIAGLVVRNGDLIHADEHGAIVVPVDLAPKVPAAAELIVRREKVVLDFCNARQFNLEGLKKVIRESEHLH